MRFASCVGLFGLPRFLHMDIWISKIHRLTLDPTGFVKSHAAARVQKDFGVTLTPIGEHNQQSQGQHNNDWRFLTRNAHAKPPVTRAFTMKIPSATINVRYSESNAERNVQPKVCKRKRSEPMTLFHSLNRRLFFWIFTLPRRKPYL